MKIKEKTQETTIFFPKNIVETTQNHTIVLKSELTNESYSFTVTDEHNYNNYYVFTMDMTDVYDGEYIYTIDSSAKGLLIVGDCHSTIDKVEYIESTDDQEDTYKYIVYED